MLRTRTAAFNQRACGLGAKEFAEQTAWTQIGPGYSNFIAADFRGDGSKVIVSYFAGSTRTAWLEAFRVTTSASLYRIPVLAGVSAVAIRH